jgi:hypothetical protein
MESSRSFVDSILPISTSKAHTVTRSEESVFPRQINIQRYSQILDDHLRFIYLQAPVQSVERILRRKKVREAIGELDPFAVNEMLMPWLHSTVRNKIANGPGPDWLNHVFMFMRRVTGMATMFLDVAIAAQQLTGLGLAGRVTDMKYRRAAASRYLFSGKQMAEWQDQQSDFMRLRINERMGQMRDDIDGVLLTPTWMGRISNWSLQHGFFLQALAQSPVDRIIWQARYDQTMAEGRLGLEGEALHLQAVEDADSAVRTTQGSGQVADMARIEKGHPFARLITQFSNIWVTQFNQIISAQTSTERARAVAATTVFAGVIAGAITVGLRGRWGEDENDDGSLWDDFALALAGEAGLATASSLVPIVSNVALPPLTGIFGGRATFGAAAGSITAAGRGLRTSLALPLRALNPDAEETTAREIRDVGTFLTWALRWPIVPFTDSASYAREVQRGNVTPHNFADLVRGLISGRASGGTQ